MRKKPRVPDERESGEAERPAGDSEGGAEHRGTHDRHAGRHRFHDPNPDSESVGLRAARLSRRTCRAIRYDCASPRRLGPLQRLGDREGCLVQIVCTAEEEREKPIQQPSTGRKPKCSRSPAGDDGRHGVVSCRGPQLTQSRPIALVGGFDDQSQALACRLAVDGRPRKCVGDFLIQQQQFGTLVF
jgi:hypothetical protein